VLLDSIFILSSLPSFHYRELILNFGFDLAFFPDSCPLRYFSSLGQLTQKDRFSLTHLIESSDVSSPSFHTNYHFFPHFKALIIFAKYFKCLSEAPHIIELTLLLTVMEHPQVFSHSIFDVFS